MLDRAATALIKPVVQALARRLAALGLSANVITVLGFVLGLFAAALIAQQAYGWGALAILVSRCCDALDGAVARIHGASDRGGFLDICLDFIFYACIPLGFAFAAPQHNALAAAVLLTAFVGTGSSFLAFAAIAAKRGLQSNAYPNKSFYFLGGLTEGSETLGCFIAMCYWPQHFAVLAYGFAALCALTTLTRLYWGWRAFGD